MDKWIQEAKDCIKKHYGFDDPERPWVMVSPPDSYNDPAYKIELYVWQGSSPKGYIVALYNQGLVFAFDPNMKKIRKWGTRND
jgi:hypothetical protein